MNVLLTVFRFYWLKRKLLEEHTQCLERSNINPYVFKPLEYYSTDKEPLQKALTDSNFPGFEETLDGLLFYHNMLHYMPGHTPLVGWLKGYMVPEMLGIPVSKKIESQRPVNYCSMQEHISVFEETYFKEKQKRRELERQREVEKTKNSPDEISSNAEFEKNKQPTNDSNTFAHNMDVI